jgi:holo-[acyl-carrier protein] synthase
MIGIGIDLCQVERFDRLSEDEAFLNKVFTSDEIAFCKRRKASSECFAARFAAKEAFVKALGTGFSKEAGFQDIEVRRDERGNPHLELRGNAAVTLDQLGVKNVHLSLSHEKTMAVAVVVIE